MFFLFLLRLKIGRLLFGMRRTKKRFERWEVKKKLFIEEIFMGKDPFSIYKLNGPL